MSRIILSLFLIFSFSSINVLAQRCATDEMLEEYFDANPGERAKFFQHQDDMASGALLKGLQRDKVASITIPVVVHVIHYNGDGNISREQVEDGIRILNEDFQKLNKDTSNTRNIFKSIAADTEIEFKLARRAPDSSCTNGIVRVNSFLTYDNRNEVKNLSYWDAENYLNVWVVNSIRTSGNGTTLGYAQFPFSSDLSTYGLVVRDDEWGSIGTASSSDGRTITHEVGHCFNLFHTFQSGCGFNCTNSGDRICDTPPVSGQGFGCDTTDNTCSNDTRDGTTSNPNPYTSNVVDQNENYMGYNDCQTMFSEGQKDRMRDALNFYSHLIKLKSNSNLIATGTNSGFVAQVCPPIAEIYLTDQLVCVGGNITFSDDSYGDTVSTYSWTFEGGTPDTSSLSQPTISYNTPGVYDVTLRVSNSAGADTLVVSDVVIVSDTNVAISAFGYSEGFESSTSVGTDWRVMNLSGDVEWERTRAASYAGSYSAYVNNFNNQSGEIDYLVSPTFDMTTVINPEVKLRVANKSLTGSERDILIIDVSSDCGQTWLGRKVLTSRDFSSGSQTNAYRPTSTNDWKEFTISLTAEQKSSTHLFFRLNFRSGGGNEIYVDDFRITGNASSVGVKEIENESLDLSIYPNPVSNENTTVEFSLKEPSLTSSLYLSNIVGKRVQQVYNGSLKGIDYRFNVETAQLSSGIYFMTLETDNGRITKKLIVK